MSCELVFLVFGSRFERSLFSEFVNGCFCWERGTLVNSILKAKLR